MSNKGSTAVAMLEDVYQAATAIVPDTPEVCFTIKASGATRRGYTLGHFAPGRFTSNGDPLPEIMIAGETVKLGPVEVLTTVLHEAAHATAAARGVKDTSRQNRYHNMRFVEIAREYHLDYFHTFPAGHRRAGQLMPDPAIGYSDVRLSKEKQILFAGVLDLLDKEFPFDLGDPPRIASKPRKRWHGYLVTYDPYGPSLVQLAPSRRKALDEAGLLMPHRYVESTADQDLVVSVLREWDIHFRDLEPSNGWRYELSDIEETHPELIQLAESMKDTPVL